MFSHISYINLRIEQLLPPTVICPPTTKYRLRSIKRENVLGEHSRGYQMIKIKKRETIVFELHDQWIVMVTLSFQSI